MVDVGRKAAQVVRGRIAGRRGEDTVDVLNRNRAVALAELRFGERKQGCPVVRPHRQDRLVSRHRGGVVAAHLGHRPLQRQHFGMVAGRGDRLGELAVGPRKIALLDSDARKAGAGEAIRAIDRERMQERQLGVVEPAKTQQSAAAHDVDRHLLPGQ